ncbi:MAG: peptidoglycan DD-metalloendopeptidase family protein [Planctomycetaceae bacterium]
MRVPAPLLLLLCAAPAAGQWGRDINPGSGPALLQTVQQPLLAILSAEGEVRVQRVKEFVAKRGLDWIEGIKRFRNPELKDLWLALLGHPDWHVGHRALLCLEYLGDATVLDAVWPLLAHAHPRMRERAAIACLKLWEGGGAPAALGEALQREEDFHVRRCLEALQRRVAGRLKPLRVHEEHRVELESGLLMAPFLNGIDALERAAPGYRLKPETRPGAGGAAKMPQAPRWCWPILGWGQEEVAGVALQPFANPRQNGAVLHTGLDVGACLEGAGYYAAADGVVKLISSGSDMGTLVVLEHNLGGGELVCAVTMHGGDTVFVQPGETVSCGQLLGTMGLGFSIENGGHFAHLHYGLYPGPFDLAHNYGYKPANAGLADWLDPARALPRLVERTRPALGDLRPLSKAVDKIVALAAKGEYARAHEAARKLRDGAEPGGEAHVEAIYLLGELERVPAAALERAEKTLSLGYPSEALALLKELASTTKGLPDAEKLPERAQAWQADPAFQKSLKAEAAFASAGRRVASMKDPVQIRALWEKLLADYSDTPLHARILEKLGG